MAILPRINVTWNESTELISEFLRYQLYRRVAGETVWVKMIRLNGRAVTAYDDYEVASDVTYEYVVTQVIYTGGEELESNFPTPSSAKPAFQGTWLHAVDNSAIYAEIPGAGGTQVRVEQDTKSLQLWNREVPVFHIGKKQAKRFGVKFRWAWGENRWEQIEAILTRQRESGSILYFRDRRGTGVFCNVTAARRDDQQGPLFRGSIDVQEIHHTVGVV